jgi:EAL domain-containing protein (putative c-di-GMP-specific phosphodiesterase class I)
MQGFLYSPPLPAEDLEKVLRRQMDQGPQTWMAGLG